MASWRQVPFCAGCLVPSSVWLLLGGQSPPSCVALSSEEKGALLCRDVTLREDGLRCSWKLVPRKPSLSFSISPHLLSSVTNADPPPFSPTPSVWKFGGRGSNLSHICELYHNCGKTGSLTPGATVGTHRFFNKMTPSLESFLQAQGTVCRQPGLLIFFTTFCLKV